jgi:outer membrane lipopolysaccharide assembly protein LptE/RlpB
MSNAHTVPLGKYRSARVKLILVKLQTVLSPCGFDLQNNRGVLLLYYLQFAELHSNDAIYLMAEKILQYIL